METWRKQMAGHGRRVRAARLRMGWSQQELSEQAGVGFQTVVRLEAGETVQAEKFHAIFKALGLVEQFGYLWDSAQDLGAPRSLPMYPMHDESEIVDERVEAAARAACQELDALFGGAPPEHAGINSNFQGLLVKHLKAMLTGAPHARITHEVHLNRLVFSEKDIGGPLHAPAPADFAGWVLRGRARTGSGRMAVNYR